MKQQKEKETSEKQKRAARKREEREKRIDMLTEKTTERGIRKDVNGNYSKLESK